MICENQVMIGLICDVGAEGAWCSDLKSICAPKKRPPAGPNGQIAPDEGTLVFCVKCSRAGARGARDLQGCSIVGVQTVLLFISQNRQHEPSHEIHPGS